MSDLIKPVIDQFKFNSMVLSLATSDLKNEDAGHRLRSGEGSSVTFLMGHLLSSRYGILKMLGAGDENPYAEQFGRNAEPQDVGDYPDISEFNEAWSALADSFHGALENATDEELLVAPPEGFPTEDQTLRGAIAFLSWHEAYHMGQIGVLRTELGYSSIANQVHAGMAAK